MRKLFITIMFTASIALTSCSEDKVVDVSSLKVRNGIVYEIYSEQPFTGKAIEISGNLEGVYQFKNGERYLYEVWENGELNVKEHYKNGRLYLYETYSNGEILAQQYY